MRTAQLYGLLLGALQILGTLAVYAFGLHSDPASLEGGHRFENIAAFVAMMACLCLGLRAIARARVASGGVFTFGVGAQAACVIAAIGGIVTALGQYLYVAFINPAYAVHLRAVYLAKTQLTPEQTAAYAAQLDFITSPLFRALNLGVTTLVFSLFIGLAYAFLFRARPAAPAATAM